MAERPIENPDEAMSAIEQLRTQTDVASIIQTSKRIIDILWPGNKKPFQVVNMAKRLLQNSNALCEQAQTRSFTKRTAQLFQNQAEKLRAQTDLWASETFELIPDTTLADILIERVNSEILSVEAALFEVYSRVEEMGPSVEQVVPPAANRLRDALADFHSLKNSVPDFDGDILHFSHFRKLYEECIHSAVVSDDLKLQALKEKLPANYFQSIQPDPVNPKAYTEVWREVVKEFTDQYRLVKAVFGRYKRVSCLQSENVDEILTFVRSAESASSSIKNLNVTDIVDTWLMIENSQKIPIYLQKIFYDKYAGKTKTLPSLKEFFSFLQERANRSRAIQTVTQADFFPDISSQGHSFFGSRSTHPENFRLAPSTAFKPKDWSSTPDRLCPFCERKHRLYNCPLFLSSTYQERVSFVELCRICPRCLGGKHTAENCFAKRNCGKCQQPHHFFLHNFGNPTDRLSQSIVNRAKARSKSDGKQIFPATSLPDIRHRQDSSTSLAAQETFFDITADPSQLNHRTSPKLSSHTNFNPRRPVIHYYGNANTQQKEEDVTVPDFSQCYREPKVRSGDWRQLLLDESEGKAELVFQKGKLSPSEGSMESSLQLISRDKSCQNSSLVSD